MQLSITCFIMLSLLGAYAGQEVPKIPAGHRSQFFLLQPDGGYHFGYDTGDGYAAEQSADASNHVVGRYFYTTNNGQKVDVKYTAGVDGFVPEGIESVHNPGLKAPESTTLRNQLQGKYNGDKSDEDVNKHLQQNTEDGFNGTAHDLSEEELKLPTLAPWQPQNGSYKLVYNVGLDLGPNVQNNYNSNDYPSGLNLLWNKNKDSKVSSEETNEETLITPNNGSDDQNKNKLNSFNKVGSSEEANFNQFMVKNLVKVLSNHQNKFNHQQREPSLPPFKNYNSFSLSRDEIDNKQQQINQFNYLQSKVNNQQENQNLPLNYHSSMYPSSNYPKSDQPQQAYHPESNPSSDLLSKTHYQEMGAQETVPSNYYNRESTQVPVLNRHYQVNDESFYNFQSQADSKLKNINNFASHQKEAGNNAFKQISGTDTDFKATESTLQPSPSLNSPTADWNNLQGSNKQFVYTYLPGNTIGQKYGYIYKSL